MPGKAGQRIFIQSLPEFVQKEVVLRGWVHRLRVLGKTTFVILKDCSYSEALWRCYEVI